MSQHDFPAVDDEYPGDDEYLPYTDDESVATAAALEPAPRAVATIEHPLPVVQTGFSERQLDLIKTTLAPGISDDQLALFAMVAERTGLDPFQRQIYAVLRNVKETVRGKEVWTKKLTIQTGIDGYLAIADRTGEFAGVDDIVFDTEESEHPNWAKATVWRWSRNGQRASFTFTARWREYVQTDKYGKPTSMWGKMPWTMLGKCALARALRQGFQSHLSGIYTTEEMMQADSALLTGEIVESDLAAPPAIAAPVARPAHTPAGMARDAGYLGVTASAAPTTHTGAPVKLPQPVEWNPLGDSPFRRRCNIVGVKSIADVEQMLRDAGALTDTDGVYRKDKALAYLVSLEAMHAEAAKASKAVAQ